MPVNYYRRKRLTSVNMKKVIQLSQQKPRCNMGQLWPKVGISYMSRLFCEK